MLECASLVPKERDGERIIYFPRLKKYICADHDSRGSESLNKIIRRNLHQFHSSSAPGDLLCAPAAPVSLLGKVGTNGGGIGVGLDFRSGFMTDDEMKMSSSLSRRDVEAEEAVIGEAARGLKYSGAVGGVEGADAEVGAEDKTEDRRGGEEIEIAEAMDCDMSERRSEARFWLLEKLR